VSLFGEQMLVQRMLFPDQLEHHEITHGTIGDREKQILGQLLDSMVTPFEPDSYSDVVVDRLRELVGTTEPTEPTPSYNLADDMERMLKEMGIRNG
jgi:non-homologous end joining protein Ku